MEGNIFIAEILAIHEVALSNVTVYITPGFVFRCKLYKDVMYAEYVS